jgi:hypothetical protein
MCAEVADDTLTSPGDPPRGDAVVVAFMLNLTMANKILITS